MNEYQIQARMRISKQKFESDVYYSNLKLAAEIALVEAKRSAAEAEIRRKFNETKHRIEEASAEFERAKRAEFEAQMAQFSG